MNRSPLSTLALTASLATGLTVAGITQTADAAVFGPSLFNEQFDSLNTSDPNVVLHPWASIDGSEGDPNPPSLSITEFASGGTSRSNLGAFSTVGNRTHRVIVELKEPIGPINSRFVNLQNTANNNQTSGFFGTGGTGSFATRTVTFASPDAGAITSRVQMGAAFINNGRTVKYDNVRINRAIAAPVVSSDSTSGPLGVGSAQTISLFNAGGTAAIGASTYDVFFDPDITGTSSNGSVSSVTWIDDTQIDLTLTPAFAGAVDLTLTNQYGDGTGNISTYSLTAIPEPGSLALIAAGGMLLLSRRRSAD